MGGSETTVGKSQLVVRPQEVIATGDLGAVPIHILTYTLHFRGCEMRRYGSLAHRLDTGGLIVLAREFPSPESGYEFYRELFAKVRKARIEDASLFYFYNTDDTTITGALATKPISPQRSTDVSVKYTPSSKVVNEAVRAVIEAQKEEGIESNRIRYDLARTYRIPNLPPISMG